MLKAIIIDDEPLVSDYLKILLQEYADVEIVGVFDNPEAALDFARSNYVDAVFSDIVMPGMNGLQFIEQLYKIAPAVGVVFTTGYKEFGAEAFDLEAVDYLLKPIAPAKLERALVKLREYCQRSGGRRPDKQIRINYFGRFDILVDGVSLNFHGNLTYQLAAFLAHKKTFVDKYAIFDALWPDNLNDEALYNNLSQLLYRLRQVFADSGLEICNVKKSELYMLKISPAYSDVAEMQALLSLPAAQIDDALLAKIRSLYSSGYLADNYWPWADELTAWWAIQVDKYLEHDQPE